MRREWLRLADNRCGRRILVCGVPWLVARSAAHYVELAERQEAARLEAERQEAALTSGPGPARLVPGPGDPALATAPWPPRSRSAANSTYFPLAARALQDFDWLLVLSEA